MKKEYICRVSGEFPEHEVVCTEPLQVIRWLPVVIWIRISLMWIRILDRPLEKKYIWIDFYVSFPWLWLILLLPGSGSASLIRIREANMIRIRIHITVDYCCFCFIRFSEFQRSLKWQGCKINERYEEYFSKQQNSFKFFQMLFFSVHRILYIIVLSQIAGYLTSSQLDNWTDIRQCYFRQYFFEFFFCLLQRHLKNLPIDKLFPNYYHGGQGCQFVMWS